MPWPFRKKEKKEEPKKEETRDPFDDAMDWLTVPKPLGRISGSTLYDLMAGVDDIKESDITKPKLPYEVFQMSGSFHEAAIKALINIGLLACAQEIDLEKAKVKSSEEINEAERLAKLDKLERDKEYIAQKLKEAGIKYTRKRAEDLIEGIKDQFVAALEIYQLFYPDSTRYNLILENPDRAVKYILDKEKGNYLGRIRDEIKELKEKKE